MTELDVRFIPAEQQLKNIGYEPDIRKFYEVGMAISKLDAYQPSFVKFMNGCIGKLVPTATLREMLTFNAQKEMYHSVLNKYVVITTITEQHIDVVNAMLARINMNYGGWQEKMLMQEVLYTNDTDFHVERTPVVKTADEVLMTLSLKIPYINPNMRYIIKSKTRQSRGTRQEVITDYTIYLPTKDLVAQQVMECEKSNKTNNYSDLFTGYDNCDPGLQKG